MDLHNIMSLISQKHSVKYYVVSVDTFKWSNIELYTSKSNKNGFGQKVCTPYQVQVVLGDIDMINQLQKNAELSRCFPFKNL